MAFPQYKKKGWWIFSKQVESGWEDRGAVIDAFLFENGKPIKNWETCARCHHRAHIAREGKKTFKFCPRCLVKLDEK